MAREEHGMVATIGHISAFPSAHIPSAHNVIPGEARLGLDLCHENDRARERAVGVLRARAVEDPREPWREVALAPAPGKPGDADRYTNLSALLARAVEDLGYPAERLPSGAGHDAAAVAEIAPIAMLFVRCKGGISHNRAESVESEDVAVAIDATSRFLALLADTLDR